jgi:hypothetical protein
MRNPWCFLEGKKRPPEEGLPVQVDDGTLQATIGIDLKIISTRIEFSKPTPPKQGLRPCRGISSETVVASGGFG